MDILEDVYMLGDVYVYGCDVWTYDSDCVLINNIRITDHAQRKTLSAH